MNLSRILLPLACVTSLFAIGQPRYVEFTRSPGAFVLAEGKGAAVIQTDPADFPGVIRAAGDLKADLVRVTGATLPGAPVIAGTLGKNATIDRLAREGRIDAKRIAGKWESFLIQVVDRPSPGVPLALVIAGSDKRGTIFGIYDVSEQIGVSPWYWWADVPVRHRDELFVRPGTYIQGPPAVKYRGIFLNDEAPSLTGWTKEKFGGYNHQFYEKVFELILRMKGNFLWPAMWGSAFNDDDPLNPKEADEYGIVMSTSHHEPMMRAQQEWKRYGKGPWDYTKNADFLREFWAGGVERNKNYESITTIAMRGDGDMPMAGTNMDENVKLLEQIVADQRKILAQKVNPDVTKVPQVWALYKEVQGYYEHGMRVPDDVTLLWSDDNWGNVRRLPTAEERKRSGGAGIYYHFDYVGGPRNYKWLNTVPITKVWEQMSMAYQYGADRIWVVNVGDLKPMEFPIEFFLHLAWNPPAWTANKLDDYTRAWCEREFGTQYGAQVADIISKYTKYNGRRKPELIDPTTFSLTDYQEAERVVGDWRVLTDQAQALYKQLPEEARDAFFQLALYPALASAQVTELYAAAGFNHLFAAQGRAVANDYATEVKRLFQADADLAAYYNHTMAHGKWDHMMDQTHIGYTYWQEPRQNNMPAVKEIEVPAAAAMGIAVEGSALAWPGADSAPALPSIDSYNRQSRYIDVFNKGKEPFTYTASADAPWIHVSASRGTVQREQRLWVSADWLRVPLGKAEGAVTVTGPAGPIVVKVAAFHPTEPGRNTLQGFVETDGCVSMEAVHFTARSGSESAQWDKIDDYGRTLSSMAIFPFTAPSVLPPAEAPTLEYRMYLFDTGKVTVDTIIAPTQNFVPGRGLRYAISFDDQPPQVIDTLPGGTPRQIQTAWETSVKDSVRNVISTHTIAAPGYHTLKLRMVDPGVVVQKIVVNLGGVKPSYLGPPESYRSSN